jgi:2-polyprenyl-3-methyl-5-hydroxy-6-metoxy-1,4-benzoquinol methylase
MPVPGPLALVATALNCEVSTLSATSGLNAHPHWDSLGHVSVVTALETHYGVVLNDESIRRFEHMDAIIELHRRLVQDEGGFDSRWETDIYGRGRMLNDYPSEPVVSFVMRAFPTSKDRAGKRVLDLGCGAGNNVRFLAREGFQVVGVDGSASAITVARQRLEADGLNAELTVMDFGELELPAATFDCVIDRCAITHNRRAAIETVLDKVRGALKPGGLFFSEMFSTRTADREYGHALGDGSYRSFTAGYFADVALTFFADREDIDALFGRCFANRSIEHVVIENGEGRVLTASWITVWQPR